MKVTDEMVKRGIEAAERENQPYYSKFSDGFIRAILESSLNPPQEPECSHHWVTATIDEWRGLFCTRCCKRKDPEPEIVVTEEMLKAGLKVEADEKNRLRRLMCGEVSTEGWNATQSVQRIYRAMRKLEPRPEPGMPLNGSHYHSHRRMGDCPGMLHTGTRLHRRKDDPKPKPINGEDLED